jgi:murein hydrolase activator
MRKSIFLFVFFFSSVYILNAQQTQDKNLLEKERQSIQKEIRDIENIYNQVKGQTKETLSQLSLLQKKLNLQNKFLSNINKELKMIDDNIYLSNVEIYRLQLQLDTLKSQYARSIVYAYKNKSNYDFLNFIFSAGSFNDMMRRLSYLKSYRQYRENQVANILETQQLIEKRKKEQLERKDQKNIALEVQTKEVKILAVQKVEKDQVVNKLKSREKELQKQIALKRKKDNDLKNSIAAIVRREIEAARKEAEKKAALEKDKAGPVVTNPAAPITNTPATAKAEPAAPEKVKSFLNLNESDVRLNNSFESNRGKLPWPVDNGFVSIHFGSYQYEGTSLKGDNPGITIYTPSSGVSVKSVFDGEVVGVFNLGDGMAVTIRHGKYFTTYSNLSSVSVNKGNDIKTGQVIGKAAAADEGKGGQVDFLLMIESKNVNPESWLRR